MIDEKPLMVEFEEMMRRKIEESIYGTSEMRQRQTALRLRGRSFETVEIGDDGKVIEPPRPCPKCGPVLACSEHFVCT